MVRTGIPVPVVTKVASPILAERERTYQLENILAWLHGSGYCGYQVAFLEGAGSPIDDVQSALNRKNRPPAGLQDVRMFWDDCLRCQNRGQTGAIAVVTFGGQSLTRSKPVFEVKGKYAGDAAVWVPDPGE
jgi:hypothetical protein